MSREEIEDDLRELSWAVLVSRDQILKRSENLSAKIREPALQAAGGLMEIHKHLRSFMARIPAGDSVPKEGLPETLASVRLSVQQTLQELSDAIETLYKAKEDRDKREANVN
jgi:hypothetical protein